MKLSSYVLQCDQCSVRSPEINDDSELDGFWDMYEHVESAIPGKYYDSIYKEYPIDENGKIIYEYPAYYGKTIKHFCCKEHKKKWLANDTTP